MPTLRANSSPSSCRSDGQKLWNWKVGAPGGPQRYALRRLPLLPQLYAPEFKPLRSDPEVNPYELAKTFTYHEKWSAPLFRSVAFIFRVMCIDTHDELHRSVAGADRGRFPPEARAAFEEVNQSIIRRRLDASVKRSAEQNQRGAARQGTRRQLSRSNISEPRRWRARENRGHHGTRFCATLRERADHERSHVSSGAANLAVVSTNGAQELRGAPEERIGLTPYACHAQRIWRKPWRSVWCSAAVHLAWHVRCASHNRLSQHRNAPIAIPTGGQMISHVWSGAKAREK
jgi:hypothetical protein